ncbi:ATP-binding protein [Cellulosilyticum ruminicola]|uniref:ATP-binding protein n=1 Tax=Cellulosilyticum ruminicola TaxID=425254 RepID=UPI0006D13115|nr:ATP-binding protein [Cellulosilyticum ruminicola]
MYIFMEILFCMIDTLFLDQFVQFILEYKYEERKKYKIPGLMLLAMGIYFVTGYEAFNSCSTLISLSLMCSYTIIMYKGTIKNKIIVATVFDVCLGLCTIVSVNLMAYLANKEISELLTYGHMTRVGVILMVKLFILKLIVAAKRIFNLKRVEMPKGYRDFALVTFVASLVTVIVMFKLSVYNTDSLMQRYIVLLAVIFFTFNIMIYALFRKIIVSVQENAKTKLILHNQDVIQEHIMELNKSHKEIRRIKHDVLNHYGILEYMVTNNEKEECLKYIRELREQAEKVPMYYNTGNMIGDAVVNQKVYSTREENIDYDLKIKFPEEMCIEEVDLGTLLVNLLDNAIEAVREVEDKKRKIKVNIHPHHNKLLINMSNTVASNPIQNNKLVQRKKLNKHEHGYGLINVKYVVDKYAGFMEYSCKNNEFEINVLIDYRES